MSRPPILTFVAIDAEGQRVRKCCPVIPETDEEKRRFEEAGERREYRLSRRSAESPLETNFGLPSSSLYMYLMLLL